MTISPMAALQLLREQQDSVNRLYNDLSAALDDCQARIAMIRQGVTDVGRNLEVVQSAITHDGLPSAEGATDQAIENLDSWHVLMTEQVGNAKAWLNRAATGIQDALS